jgi:UDP-N-acetylglucosamine--N-acetylmuramyl-(pentapeptide) pyrophosphoryl-undecaprenol N-acetylglucosamine transferase
VTEDHQTHNAMALVRKDAAILIKDIDANSLLVKEALTLIKNKSRLESLEKNILTLAQPDSAHQIALEVIKLAKKQ